MRFALRTLLKDRGFAAVAILTLALGIGANTAVYSLTDQILLRRLPVRNPDELVILRMPGPKSGTTWSDIDEGAQSFSYPFYQDLRDRNPVFGGLLARFAISLSVSGEGRTERADGELVSGNYFEVLGVRPALGRLLGADDAAQPGGLVLREAMAMTAIGLVIGLPAALAAGRLARSLLFGVMPGDPLLLLGSGLLLIGVMLAAAYLPARRATKVDPMLALRCE